MININNLSKSFGEKVVFNNLSFSLEKNKILVILGPSGCGKSTLLNIIGGIDKNTMVQLIFLTIKFPMFFRKTDYYLG